MACDIALLKVGSKLKDNDPRCEGRTLVITEILPDGVAARDGAGRTRFYLMSRIHTDGKPRRSGLNLVVFQKEN